MGEIVIWVRRCVAGFLTLAVFAGLGFIILMLAGVVGPNLSSAPGLRPAEAEALSAPFAELMAGHDEALKKSFVDGVNLDAAGPQLIAMREVVPAAKPTARRLIQWTKNLGPKGIDLYGAHEQTYPDRVVRIRTEIFRPNANSPWRLVNFAVNAASTKELEGNKFSLTHKSPLFIAVVVGALLVPLFVWLTAVACLLLNDVRGRWFWLPFILIGFTSLSAATNGAWSFQVLWFLLFGAGALWTGSAFDPWVFSVSVPVGAVLFWIIRARKKASFGSQPENSFG